MNNYNILADYEEQRKLQEIDEECQQIKKTNIGCSKDWVFPRAHIMTG